MAGTFFGTQVGTPSLMGTNSFIGKSLLKGKSATTASPMLINPFINWIL